MENRNIDITTEKGRFKSRVHCSIYITNVSLDNLAREIKKLDKKYNDYEVEIARVETSAEKMGDNLFFSIIKKE